MHGRVILLEECIDLLSISTRFDFEAIRQRAIHDIDYPHPFRRPLDPINKIVLAEKHDIPKWLAPAYAALCQRANPLELWEAQKLGMEKTVLLHRAREAVRELAPGSPVTPCYAYEPPLPQPSIPSEPYQPYSASGVARIVSEVFFPTSRPECGSPGGRSSASTGH